ncbi:MAG: DNA topoisomerase 3, partial [Candidatus Thiodiazotropha weberae]|nr:DNA topoisomerase 3 [Candidatus Thiodiazotropha lotti]MCW4211408.1 DNA topoisomerase 3 [Candidatus Thiodiazotropha lotti]
GQDCIVTWCFGHLLEMASPDQYDESLKRWSLDSLPIVPERWVLAVKKEARKQFKVIQQLLKQASSVVVATDADREGETIAREILDQCRWRGPIQRLWLSALDDKSIRKALSNILPGQQTEPLYQAGLGRARADWLVGMNLTRAYTLIGRQQGHDGVLSVGRVQTPTLNLVVQRDLEIEAFKPSPYYVLTVEFEVANGRFRAKWLPPETVTNTEGRCTNQQAAINVAQRIDKQVGTIVTATTEHKREPAPLPFDLSSLQQEASKRWGMSAQLVLDTAQALYETHKALTYPRTDCPYLPLSQHSEVEQVLKAMSQSNASYRELTQSANTSLQSRAWNDKKITAHHAIIPTTSPTDTGRMNANERKLYDLVCRRYLAQFFPDHEYEQTTITLSVCDETFRATGKTEKSAGWRVVQSMPSESNEADSETNQPLPRVEQGSKAHVRTTDLKTKQTKPPARFTEGTLIAAMKNIGKQIEDPALKKVLRETSGIGTEATRAGIIETLVQRGFIKKQKKHVISTNTGRTLIAILPNEIKDPATTALWEQGLDDIAQGKGQLATFIQGQAQWINTVLRQSISNTKTATASTGFANTESTHPCPACGKPLRRRKSSNGFFWGCSAYPDCKTTLPDNKGKPTQRKSAYKTQPHKARVGDTCPECKKGKLVLRSIKNGKNEGKSFLGCTSYPKCRYFLWHNGE